MWYCWPKQDENGEEEAQRKTPAFSSPKAGRERKESTISHEAKRSILGEAAVARTVALLVLTVGIVSPSVASALDPPDPLNVLFAANGYYTQEDEIEDHFIDLGYTVTVIKDYQLKGTTNLAPYDLIVLTEFASCVPTSGINNIKASDKPLLIVEYWDFWYSYRFGLTATEDCGYVGTDTITAVEESYNELTSRVGGEALVYQPYYTVYGIHISDVEPGITPLYWSSEYFNEVAVLIDPVNKIAATGVYDTRKYTNDAWKMFDTLVELIAPVDTGRETINDVAEAYAWSGIMELLSLVEQDLERDPNSWTFEEAEEEAWLITVEWRLEELWGHLTKKLALLFQYEPQWPQPIYDHPTRTGFPDEYWFLGQAYPGPPYSVPHYAEYHDGTDLGMSVEIDGKTIYFMGDTTGEKQSPTECPATAYCNDMMAISWDSNPDDGVNVLITRPAGESGVFLPQMVPGVHKDIAPKLTGYWGDTTVEDYIEPEYTVPTGVVVANPVFSFLIETPNPLTFTMEMVVLWYSTAIHPGGGGGTISFDSDDPKKRPTSWNGCSFDGYRFHKCRSHNYSPYHSPPFSIDETVVANEPARFIQVAAIEITAADFESVCDGIDDSAFCYFYDSTAPEAEKGGLLLYGSGRPYRKSGLFLAYMRNKYFGHVDPMSGKAFVRYWNGSGWSPYENDAVSLTHDASNPPQCDDDMTPNDCLPSQGELLNLFGELSAKLIRSGSEESVIVLLSNHLFYSANDNNVRARTARLSTPWIVSVPSEPVPGTKGYGPYIIDEYIEHDGYTGDIGLYHTISVWRYGPYGVYTGYEEVAWP